MKLKNNQILVHKTFGRCKVTGFVNGMYWRIQFEGDDKNFTGEVVDFLPEILYANIYKINIGSVEVILSTVPKVGMGATTGYNGDSYPHTIHKVSKDLKTVWVSSDNYTAIPKANSKGYEYGEEVPYTYSNNDTNKPTNWSEYKLRKNGYYIQKGVGMNSAWFFTLYLDYRRYRQNPEF